MEKHKTPLKKGRSHSDVEPDTPSPSITQQPKSSRLSNDEKQFCRETLRDTEVISLMREEIQDNFRMILQEEIARGNIELLVQLNGMKQQIDSQMK